MFSKLSLPAFVSLAAVSTVLFGSVAASAACPFADKSNPSDSMTSINPPSQSDAINSNSSNKFGIAGAGLAALLGLYAGGMFLKAKLAKPPSDLTEPEAEFAHGQVETYKEFSAFPIVVPAEALSTNVAEAATDEVASLR